MPQMKPKVRWSRHQGFSMAYSILTIVVLIGFTSFAVDLGRAQLAKTQLQAAADAAALYGAQGMSDNTWNAKAISAAAENTVDGNALTLLSGDVTTVTWNNGTLLAGNPSPNAVQIIARKSNARGTAVPLFFAGIFGQRTLDLSITSIAQYTANANFSAVANSKGNPWLAGMPDTTVGNSFDTAPANSPTLLSSGLTLTSGTNLNFSFAGAASYKPTAVSNDADGDLSRMIYNCYYNSFSYGREHGKANLTAPIGSVVGIFLNDTQPDLDPASLPPDLDFSTAASRDFSSLSPELRQPFYIGDGKRADGTTLQNFVVPSGATRFYIGIMDGQQWSDNSGSFTATLKQPGSIRLVR